MQSEVSGHIGSKGNRFCRKCQVGGTTAHKVSDCGFHELFEPGIPRTKDYVLSELRAQVGMACSGISRMKLAEEQRLTGVKDAYTQHWITGLIDRHAQLRAADVERSVAAIKAELTQWTTENDEKIYSAFLTTKGFDPTYRDTPVELLHTILLGAVKYVWHVSHTSWSQEAKETYSLRLQAAQTDGLSIHAIRAGYIMQYANSLIGKQLKTIVQTGVFHVYDLVPGDHLAAWRALGELSALLWVPEIQNPNEYQNDLKQAVANLLDAIAIIDPSKIVTKIKYHLLSHVAADAAAFGPLIGLATELFESFNAVFRYCSIFSNHLAPSRDIALQLGDQEGLKHRLTGGLWLSASTKQWETAGPGEIIFPARILEILSGASPGDNIIVVERFQCSSTRDTIYGMPILTRPNGEHVLTIIRATDIKYNFNAQHDCHAAGCAPTGVRPIMQERVESEKTERFIIHADMDRFIVNTHAFHNAHLIRATLSRALWEPTPLLEDRQAKHTELASQLRAKKSKGATAASTGGTDVPDNTQHNSKPGLGRGRGQGRGRGRSRTGTGMAARSANGASSSKRRRSISSHEDAPPHKRGRPRKSQPRIVLPAVSIAITGNTSLAAGRTRREITRTARAVASEAQEAEFGSDEDELDSDNSGTTDSDSEQDLSPGEELEDE
ncbi:hypothetical protein MIND_00397100 [Mycena indigotica]|uniref:Uncharacterized protein n=1 Tax=Mycena indigotica TaxID=2126181 RepID=A0A8H6T3J1_9AGAR|nr:uncharacterized protein MIND_00397100 [Mycena indigotica]KAF7310234.1 hypothetical protein MIND_00397100 [Mycena indigotica]